uniref:Uncharacterized protein n=1 Tax=Aegilops tauschii TaxID=37682 RepID=M8B3Y5_AEGTA
MEEPPLTPPRNKAEEIKSPPTPREALKTSSLSLQRQKPRARPTTHTPRAVGTTPLDIRGLPIPERDLPRTGGWVATFFIFGNETAERMAYYGLSVNMVVFMFKVMHLPFAASANAVNNFLGISQASSVLGGFLADAYLGRYWTIAAFTTLYLLGLIALTLCATLPALVPAQDGCDKLAMLLGGCAPAERWQMAYLYTALYVTAFGAAGIRPCCVLVRGRPVRRPERGLQAPAGPLLQPLLPRRHGDVRNGRPSWLAQNINVGRFDYLYWLLAVLSTINFAVFLYFASIYKYRTPPPTTTAGSNSSKVEVSVVSGHK